MTDARDPAGAAGFPFPIFPDPHSPRAIVGQIGEFAYYCLCEAVLRELVEQYSAFGLDEKGAMDRLLAAGKDPTRIDKIFIYAPALNPHRAWVQAVIEKAIDIVKRELSVGPGEEVPEPESKNGTKPEDIPAHKDGEPT